VTAYDEVVAMAKGDLWLAKFQAMAAQVKSDVAGFNAGLLSDALSYGAREISSATGVLLTSTDSRIQVVTQTATGQAVTLPDATTDIEGRPWTISNGGTSAFAVNDAAAVQLVAAVAVGETYMIMLIDGATAAGVWLIERLSNPPAPDYDDTALQTQIALLNLRHVIDLGLPIIQAVNGIADEYENMSGVDFYTAPASEVLNVNFDGADAATSATDSSTAAQPLTFVGNAQLDTAQFREGGSSLLLDGNGDYISIANHANNALGTGDFSIECWYRPNVLPAGVAFAGAFASKGDPSTTGWLFGHGGTQIFVNIANVQVLVGTSGFVVGNWYHVALARVSGVMKIYVDGVEVASASVGTDLSIAAAWQIGAISGWTAVSRDIDGWIEDYRVLKGASAYSAAFYPPRSFNGISTDVTYDEAGDYLHNPASANMVLVSVGFTAVAVPATGRVVCLHEPVAAVTYNTDFTIEVSRDGGTTWTVATINDEGEYAAGINILSTDPIDLTGQPSGSDMRYRLKTLNEIVQIVHATYLQWS